ncbi:MAG: PepSY domain-containing protein [Rhodospirillum sp.]|nr:PepSY domain-containing protein [Rhodospirillum sp.]MCF8490066.1 PepSY domain-containing protein [Rhodospirillum sp.]MCF8500425.1 PepSY domain-containing protein [Rhodospirillum sp.]
MKKTMQGMAVSVGLLVLMVSPAMAGEVSAETQAAISAKLAEMHCEVDPDNVEAEGDGYELDDVFCADGQYDMDLNATFDVVEKRKE